jgi:pre-mRNA-processing factor 40
MSDSDRQLYFADFVIELQAAEDDKRRRIRDARRRAEKAQREAYRDFLRKLATDGKILPYTRWRNAEELVSADDSFKLVEAQDRDAPHELFVQFVDEWGETYRRERSFLNRLLHPSNKKEIVVKVGTSFDEFTKLLLDEAAYSPDVYGDARRMINREEPVSSARLCYDELIARASESSKSSAVRRRSMQDDSSEDEGEIIEDGELPEEGGDAVSGESPSTIEKDDSVDAKKEKQSEHSPKEKEVSAIQEEESDPKDTPTQSQSDEGAHDPNPQTSISEAQGPEDGSQEKPNASDGNFSETTAPPDSEQALTEETPYDI